MKQKQYLIKLYTQQIEKPLQIVANYESRSKYKKCTYFNIVCILYPKGYTNISTSTRSLIIIDQNNECVNLKNKVLEYDDLFVITCNTVLIDNECKDTISK